LDVEEDLKKGFLQFEIAPSLWEHIAGTTCV
jgi:hypothetical protein